MDGDLMEAPCCNEKGLLWLVVTKGKFSVQEELRENCFKDSEIH